MSKMMAHAFKLFDKYNQRDPDVIKQNDQNFPATYFYALKLYDWVLKLKPDANEGLLLASRCQHIGRWEISRHSYPEGKAGYLNWRSDLAKYHAEKSAEFLKQAGYSPEIIQHVQRIVLKQKIKLDADVQLMENALCLVFLEYQFEDFISEHDDNKVIHILKKTLSKMDDHGRAAALNLTFSNRAATLISKALSK